MYHKFYKFDFTTPLFSKRRGLCSMCSSPLYVPRFLTTVRDRSSFKEVVETGHLKYRRMSCWMLCQWTPQSRLHVLWPFLLIDSQICWHILYLLKFFFSKETFLRTIYNSSWTLLSVIWSKLRKLWGRFGLPLIDAECVTNTDSYKQRNLSAAMNFRYWSSSCINVCFMLLLCVIYVNMENFGFISEKNKTVSMWRGVMSQKKWSGHPVTRCHVPEEMERSLRDAV
jgi:hypothetical protein